MSKKYVIEMKSEYEDTIRGIMVLGARDSNLYTDALAVEDMEELNSDYINEHFGSLQDTAYKKGLHDGESKCRYCNEYQRGLEDGKAVNDKGCDGCKYSGTPQGDSPCFNCSNYYQNNWTAKGDKIEVGDELIAYGGSKCIATVADCENDIFYVMFADGSCGKKEGEILKRTGRHFDIQNILEAMKE